MLEELGSSPVRPVYSQVKPNQAINLGSVPVDILYEGGSAPATVRVVMRFLPNRRLLFLAKAAGIGPALGHALFTSKDLKLRLMNRDVTVDAFCLASGSEGVTIVSKRLPIAVTPPTNEIVKLVFHIFNFPEFLGNQDYSLHRHSDSGEGYQRCGRAVLTSDGWTITIAETDRCGDLCKALKKQGGFVITHTGSIERQDGSAFPSDQVQDLLQCIYYFLSFALGRWVGIALPIGFDRTERTVFEEWGEPTTPPGAWAAGFSWFCPHHGELLPEVFPGFLAKWKDGFWNRSLRQCLYWYISASGWGTGVAPDIGLILAQTALELLAWTYCVQHRKMISAEAFDPGRLSAADRLRLLASAFHLPLEIPSCLQKTRSAGKWKDAMDAISGVRNEIVHPRARAGAPRHLGHEVWKMSLWYLDMVLLSLCGHQGVYMNRLRESGWVGETERVPWA